MATVTNASDKEALTKLNAQYVADVQAGDVTWFDKNLADDFMVTQPDGSFFDKAGFLELLAQPPVMSGLKEHDVLVRIFSDEFAIIHAAIDYRGRDGQPYKGRFTDDWVKRGGVWKCVSAHTVGDGFAR